MIWVRVMDGLRMVLCSTMNAFIFFFLMKKIFPLKRPPYLWLGYTLFKNLFVVGFCFNVAFDWIQQSKGLYLAYHVFVMTQGILLATILILTFQGNPVKIVILSMMIESVAILIGICSIAIVNLIEGRNVRLLYIGRVEFLDILVPVFAFFLYQMVCKIGQGLFQKLRTYELKYTKAWGILFIVFWVSGGLSHQLQTSQVSEFYYMEQILLMIFEVMIFLVITSLYVYSVWKKQTLRKHQYLEKQKELIEIHIQGIQNQIRWMEQSQKEMNAQMNELLTLECEKEKNQKFSMYLTQLKEQYKNMTAGVYCGDNLVDSVLYYFAKHFSKKDISYEFSFQQYQSQIIPSEDVGELVFQLLNLVRTGPVSLKVQVMGEMLCFEYRCHEVKKKTIKKAFMWFFQTYQVEIWQDKKEQKGRFLICIKS